jgi:hypothetical protein
MNNNYLYAKQKLNLVLRILAVGTEDIRYRLRDAYSAELHVLKETDFPRTLQKEFSWIIDKIRNYRLHGDSDKTNKKITKSTGAKIAYKILELGDKLKNYN